MILVLKNYDYELLHMDEIPPILILDSYDFVSPLTKWESESTLASEMKGFFSILEMKLV